MLPTLFCGGIQAQMLWLPAEAVRGQRMDTCPCQNAKKQEMMILAVLYRQNHQNWSLNDSSTCLEGHLALCFKRRKIEEHYCFRANRIFWT